jgi:hypothetical protein
MIESWNRLCPARNGYSTFLNNWRLFPGLDSTTSQRLGRSILKQAQA